MLTYVYAYLLLGAILWLLTLLTSAKITWKLLPYFLLAWPYIGWAAIRDIRRASKKTK